MSIGQKLQYTETFSVLCDQTLRCIIITNAVFFLVTIKSNANAFIDLYIDKELRHTFQINHLEKT